MIVCAKADESYRDQKARARAQWERVWREMDPLADLRKRPTAALSDMAQTIAECIAEASHRNACDCPGCVPPKSNLRKTQNPFVQHEITKRLGAAQYVGPQE